MGTKFMNREWAWPKLGEVAVFRLTLNAETDRGVALVSAAYIEGELQSLLERTFVNEPKTVGKLFQYPGPLGSFSSKIDLVFAMGLIDRNIHRSLHLIKRIRNSCAHCHEERSFSDEDIKAQCEGLMQIGTSIKDRHPRKLFISSCMAILAGLYIHIRLAKNAQIAEPLRIDTFQGSIERVKALLNGTVSQLPDKEWEALKHPKTKPKDRAELIVKLFQAVGINMEDLQNDK